MSHKNIHQYAFWLYGVIVGLALKEAIAGSGQHVIGLVQDPSSNLGLGWGPEACRILIFLILIIRFYLGSAFYFDETYFRDPQSADPKTSRYYFVDFLFGLIHFLFFFALAATIEIHGTAVNNFRWVLGLILIYDIAWLLGAHYRRRILRWMVMNLMGLGAGVVVFWVCRAFSVESFLAERWAFVPIGLQSFVDIAETMIGRPIGAKAIGTTGESLGRFSKWLNDASDVPLDAPPDVPPTAPPDVPDSKPGTGTK